MYRSAVVLLFLVLATCAHEEAAVVPAAEDAQVANEQFIPAQTETQLQQLVAPIALYPDALVAQILAASVYPTQIQEAAAWMQQLSNPKGEELAKEVDKQPWDPSVKALIQFPTVLANMQKNQSWTSSLGDAYSNQQQDVLNAVQVMRQRAQQAGNLKSTPQQQVATQGQTILIEPADAQVVYVPVYDPWLVYGPPLAVYPGWVPYDGLYAVSPGISFGFGFGIGFFGGFGWGFHHWDCDWDRRFIVFNHGEFHHERGEFGHGRGGFDHDRGGFGHGRGGFDHGRGESDHGAGFHGGPARGPESNGPPQGVAHSGSNHGGMAPGRGVGGSGFQGGGAGGGGFHGSGASGGFHGGMGGGGFHGGGAGGGFHGGRGGGHG